MDSKILIHAFIIAIIVSLACAAIYASETAEISNDVSSNNQDSIHISESKNNDSEIGLSNPIHTANHVDLPSVYV